MDRSQKRGEGRVPEKGRCGPGGNAAEPGQEAVIEQIEVRAVSVKTAKEDTLLLREITFGLRRGQLVAVVGKIGKMA